MEIVDNQELLVREESLENQEEQAHRVPRVNPEMMDLK